MKQNELSKVIEDYKESGINATYKCTETYLDTFTYDRDVLCSKVVISVSRIGDITNSLEDIILTIKKIYDFFIFYHPKHSYVRDPILSINGDVDHNVVMGVSNFDEMGRVNIGFKCGLNYADHFVNKSENIEISADVVFVFEIEQEEKYENED